MQHFFLLTCVNISAEKQHSNKVLPFDARGAANYAHRVYRHKYTTTFRIIPTSEFQPHGDAMEIGEWRVASDINTLCTDGKLTRRHNNHGATQGMSTTAQMRSIKLISRVATSV